LGWAVFAACVCAILFYHLWHLAVLARWLAQPVPGEVPEGRGTWDDILTALHRYERDGRRREQLLADALIRFRRAAQALPDGVVILDSQSHIEWFNDTAASQLGLDARTDLGQSVTNLIRAPAFVDYLSQGDHREASAVRVPVGSGGLLALQLIPYGESQRLLLARDVTQAERLETMRRDFVANVSHELRTPLTVLVGFLETVRELKLDPQRTRDYLGMMQEQAARMHRIIEDLLTLSVLESAPPPAGERIRVKPLLERVLSDAAALSADATRSRCKARPRWISWLRSRARERLRQPCDQRGALHAAGRRGAHPVARRARRRVVHGRGQRHRHRGRAHPALTERFYRIDRSRSRETGGTGLGLAIVKHAVARHQANLEVDSRPGSGSRFNIRFPPSRTLPSEASLVSDRG